MHLKFLRMRLFITTAIWSCAWSAIWVTYLAFPFWALNSLNSTQPLTQHSADVPALDGPGCFGPSTDVLALFSAASSGSVYLRFSSVIELSFCVMYVNCSSDRFVISSNLAFWVDAFFLIFQSVFRNFCRLK